MGPTYPRVEKGNENQLKDNPKGRLGRPCPTSKHPPFAFRRGINAARRERGRHPPQKRVGPLPSPQSELHALIPFPFPQNEMLVPFPLSLSKERA